MAQVREWLSNCMTNHSQCKKPIARRGQFPSRLLSVEADIVRVSHAPLCPLSSEVGLIIWPGQLEDASRVDPCGHYVAPSHCWGKAKMPICLESGTIGQLKSGIPLSALPRSFRDAISVVRSMGQNYIWIDSLCIIQDSAGDWTREGMQMGSIYDNAWCCIVASHAHNSTEGCFVTRDSRLLQPCVYDPPPTLRSPKYGNRPLHLVSVSLWKDNVDGAPLNSRAWVVQERLLSSRIVHFGAEQVFWECQELAACESFPAGLPRQIIEQVPGMPVRSFNTFKSLLSPFPGAGAAVPPSALTSLSVRDAAPDPALAYETWCEIVAGYTQCSLT